MTKPTTHQPNQSPQKHPPLGNPYFTASDFPAHKEAVIQVAENQNTSEPSPNPIDVMRQAIVEGLSKPPQQKTLPCAYFYNEAGSQLYETITTLPEYYPTRTEANMLTAMAEAFVQIPNVSQWVELGSGSSSKTRILLDAWQNTNKALTYIPIDISQSMLTATVKQLRQDYPTLQVTGLCGTYETALAHLPPSQERIVLFLGSTIGNFSPEVQTQFFQQLKTQMKRGSRLLLGFDRRPNPNKPTAAIVAAYNDQQGVTAQFNLNLLRHLNETLQCDFQPAHWRHEAIYNPNAHQIEMYLISTKPQTITLPGTGNTYAFETGERILTEISRKFDPDELAHWFQTIGFQRESQWRDPMDYFSLMLLQAT